MFTEEMIKGAGAGEEDVVESTEEWEQQTQVESEKDQRRVRVRVSPQL